MTNRGAHRKLFAAARDRKFALLPGGAGQLQPNLPQVCSAHRDVIDGNEIVARPHAVLFLRHRRLTVELGDADDRKSPIVFGPEHQADHIEVRNIEGPPDIEISRRVGVIQADAIVEQGMGADHPGSSASMKIQSRLGETPQRQHW